MVWFAETGAIFLGFWLSAGAVLSLLAISVWALAAVAFVTTWLVIAHCSGYLFHVAVEARSRGVSFWEMRAQPFYPQIRESFARKMPIK